MKSQPNAAKYVLSFVLLATSGFAAHAQNLTTDLTLEQVVKTESAGEAFMGNVLVAENGSILIDRSYGSANVEWGVPNTPKTKFRIGSLTKQFTAALVLLLQQDGKLKIADPISKYFADLPKSWSGITISELLHHTSGIPDFTDLNGFRKWSMVLHTPDEELAFFRSAPLKFEPGSSFAYSNSNYELLGMLIEHVGGSPYADQLNGRILRPLGMTDSGLDRDDLVLRMRAQGYGLGEHGLVPARTESMSVPWAAGSMYSTSGDLLRWESGLFGGKLLNDESLAEMTTPGRGQYGLGVQVIQQSGETVVWHDGGIEGFSSYLSYTPSRKLAVVVLANVVGDAPDIIGRKLLKAELVKPFASPIKPAAQLNAPVELQLGNAKPQSVKLNSTMFFGWQSLQVTDDGAPELGDAGRLAIVPNSVLQDGIIDIDLAGDTVPNAALSSRGFVGLAFRVATRPTKFECFYLRPKNGRSDDQLQRNHSVQYISLPGYPWEKLRAAHPGQFESYTDLVPGQWTHVTIVVRDSTARLFVNHSEQPALIVNELKQEPRAGSVALWIGPGTLAHFANLIVQSTK